MMNNRSFSNYYLELYLMCKEFNCLPYEGGFLDQPAKIAEAFGLIKRTIAQYQANRREVKHASPKYD
jgi:hypothetical protein